MATVGDKTVVIDGKAYKVTLIRVSEPTNDPKTIASKVSGEVNHGSEWNRLMCQIHEQALSKSWDYPGNRKHRNFDNLGKETKGV